MLPAERTSTVADPMDVIHNHLISIFMLEISMSGAIPMTIRLETEVRAALAARALVSGQETADYAADLICSALMPDVKRLHPNIAKRIDAEMHIKGEVVKLARAFVKSDGTRDHFDVTLRVFQKIRTNKKLDRLYRCAIGGREPTERGNGFKADLNRAIGAAIKTAVDATPRMKDGKPDKVQVSNEYIFFFTPLILSKKA
jgi:hypothetical protein